MGIHPTDPLGQVSHRPHQPEAQARVTRSSVSSFPRLRFGLVYLVTTLCVVTHVGMPGLRRLAQAVVTLIVNR